VRTLASAPVRGVVVVVSPEGAAVAEEARRAGAGVVTNDAPGADMLGSVRCGLRALPADCDAALVALGDQPTVRAEVVEGLVRVLATHAGGIILPAYGGVRGHPLLIASRWFDEILNRYDGVGLRGLLAAHPEAVVEVPVADSEVLHDVDDAEAYRRAVATLNQTPGAPPRE
jgi:molybdenum cofactor cytidylyltransferase